MADSVEVIKTPLSLVIDSGVSNASAVVSASSNITASVDWTGVSSKPTSIASATISVSAITSTSATISSSTTSIDWSNVQSKPSTIASATISASTTSIDWTNVQSKPSTIASATISSSAIISSSADWNGVSNKPTTIASATISASSVISASAVESSSAVISSSATTLINGASVSGSVSFTAAKPLNFFNAAATPLLMGVIRGTNSYLLMQASANFRISDVAGTSTALETFNIYSNDTEFSGDVTANNIEALTSITAPLIQSNSISTVSNGDITSARDVAVTRNLNVTGSAQINGKVNIGGNLQVDGTITSSSAASAGTLYLSSSAIRTWAASVTVECSSGSGTYSLSLPTSIRGDGKRLYATLTERDATTPRFIFSSTIGATSVTIKARNVVDTSSNDDATVDIVIVSIEP